MGTLILLFFLVYAFPCVIIGAMGLALNDKFWFYFWIAVLLTPIIGLIAVLYDVFWCRTPLNPHDDFWENITGYRLD